MASKNARRRSRQARTKKATKRTGAKGLVAAKVVEPVEVDIEGDSMSWLAPQQLPWGKSSVG